MVCVGNFAEATMRIQFTTVVVGRNPARPNWESVLSEVELELVLDELQSAAESHERQDGLAAHSISGRLVRQLTARV
jgi:hypothetical protein